MMAATARVEIRVPETRTRGKLLGLGDETGERDEEGGKGLTSLEFFLSVRLLAVMGASAENRRLGGRK